MKFEYETSRLNLRVLSNKHKYARQVLDFYNRNRDVFDKYEPTRPQNFYTEKYQATVLNCEYQMFVHTQNMRFWLYEKGYPDTIIGTICFYNITRSIFQHCCVGYKVDQKHWNRGYAKEALSYMIPQAFLELDIHRMEAQVMPDNEASIHLMESLGFQREGLCRQTAKIQGIWADHLLYALIRDDIMGQTPDRMP